MNRETKRLVVVVGLAIFALLFLVYFGEYSKPEIACVGVPHQHCQYAGGEEVPPPSPRI